MDSTDRLALAGPTTDIAIEELIHEGKTMEFFLNIHDYEFVGRGKRTRDFCEIGVKVFGSSGVFLQWGKGEKTRQT